MRKKIYIIKNVKDFMDVYSADHCGEFHSYDLAHKRFVDLRHDKKPETVDYLALNLFTVKIRLKITRQAVKNG